MTEKRIKIERRKEGRNHITHLKETCIMHLNIIEKLTDRALSFGVMPEKIEVIFESGYIRED